MFYYEIKSPDDGLQCIFLCGARTSAPQKLLRTHFRTHLDFGMIALFSTNSRFFFIILPSFFKIITSLVNIYSIMSSKLPTTFIANEFSNTE